MDEKIFAAFAVDWEKGTYEIYLVNPTEVHYKQVSTYTGAFCSDDDALIETSRCAKNLGELRPYSWLRLEEDTSDALDFVIWYWVDLIPLTVNQPVKKLALSLPKYGYATCYEEKSGYLPIIEKKCPLVEVGARSSNLSMDEQIQEDRQNKRIPVVLDIRL